MQSPGGASETAFRCQVRRAGGASVLPDRRAPLRARQGQLLLAVGGPFGLRCCHESEVMHVTAPLNHCAIELFLLDEVR